MGTGMKVVLVFAFAVICFSAYGLYRGQQEDAHRHDRAEKALARACDLTSAKFHLVVSDDGDNVELIRNGVSRGGVVRPITMSRRGLIRHSNELRQDMRWRFELATGRRMHFTMRRNAARMIGDYLNSKRKTVPACDELVQGRFVR